MKQLIKALRTRLWSLYQQVGEKTANSQSFAPSRAELAEDEKLLEKSIVQPEQQPEQVQTKIILKKIAQKFLLSDYQQRAVKTPSAYYKASLFPDGKTSVAALSLVLGGVAEVLPQKMNLPWKADSSNSLSFEKKVDGGKGKICYYVTDNPDSPYPETLAEEAALAVIDQFDPRAGAIHLIFCAQVANLDQPWEGDFVIDHRQLLEYTCLVKRRDLCKQEQLKILYDLLRQTTQVLASIVWPKQGQVGAFTVAVKEAEWQVELETGPAWLRDNIGTKRPIGFWNELLKAR